MKLFTSSNPNCSFTNFSPSQNPNSFPVQFGLRSVTISSPFSQFQILCSAKSREQESYSVSEEGEAITEIDGRRVGENDLLVVRRPVAAENGGGGGKEKRPLASLIDDGLSEFAKKMPMFEPERVGSGSAEKLLTVNLDLALYRANVLARNFRFAEAQKILEKVIAASDCGLICCVSNDQRKNDCWNITDYGVVLWIVIYV